MKLSELVHDLSFLEKRHFSDVEIQGVTSHSGEVKQGSIFVAIVGTKVDGHLFIEKALQNGAAALVVEREIPSAKKIPVFKVENSRAALSSLAAAWYGHPSAELPVVGVTGTNGKTTITYLLGHIFKSAGKNPGVLGTIGCRFNDRQLPAAHTTPESTEIQRLFREMRLGGVDVVAMEVSSHSVDMRRVDDVRFDVAAFTNLTPEHLDYHKSMELYFESKKRLFQHLLPRGKGVKRAVVNADDRYGLKLIDSLHSMPVWTYSLQAQSKWDFYIREWRSDLQSMSGVLATPQGVAEFHSPLIGAFNLSNILAATAAACALDIPLPTILEAVASFTGVPGRLERIANERGLHVFVDYAHTPDALKNVLRALSRLNPAKIITVFGCGGDRDRAKRPIMGREVARLSNVAILTSDNPRTEDPQKIIQEIIPGVEEGGMTLNKECFVEPDRKKAIELAIGMAKSGEVVLIAGKGHEDYQILGTEKIHFDDREEAFKCLSVEVSECRS
ncbi:MAG TPA: UDP-N-acetylmuramoyl-L-alanyl-D-glutamate--2,6-diaminopimelate ligase [Deltaproteobacteria bacterium]|nr:UDP-N-acetylmuramoyl-L-alanyl-D-glutamate--2,6-diaminopimelate ligase [Deltaproteobacteria bacterium]